MHLVFLNQYYPPDVAPTGVMLAAVVERLVLDGHEVTVLCAAGGYAEGTKGLSVVCDRLSGDDDGRADRPRSADMSPEGRAADGHALTSHPPGESRPSEAAWPYPQNAAQTTDYGQAPCPPRILRLRATTFGRGTFAGKLVDYVSYYAGVCWKLLTLRPAPQRIVALTTPPYLSVVARVISKFRGADHAHWVMDLYPDVLAAHGMLDDRGVVYRMLAGLARWGFGGTRCAALLTLGPDMAERVVKRVSGGRWAMKTRDTTDDDGRKIDTNIERSTSNIEHRTKEDCSETLKHRAQAPPATANGQPPTLAPPPPVQWVPLWGVDGVGGQLAVSGDDDGRADRPRSADMSPEGRTAYGHALTSHPSGESRPSEAAWPYPQNAPAPTDYYGQPTTPPPASALRQARGWDDDDLIVMYSGNMGLGHRFEEILAAAAEVGKRAVGGDCDGRADRPRSADMSPEGRAADGHALSSHPPGESRPSEAAWPYPQNAPAPTDNGPPAHALHHARGGDCDARADRPRSADMSPEGRLDNDPALTSHPPGESRPSRAAWPYPQNAQAPQTTATPRPSLRFVFFGGGKRREELASFVRENPSCGVELHDYAPADNLTAHLQSADVHLASLDPAWTGTMVPSKVQGIFEAGRPVIFIGSALSSIGQWVLASGGGWVVAAGDVSGLLDALAEASDPTTRTTRGRAAKAFARDHFQQGRNVARVVEILTR